MAWLRRYHPLEFFVGLFNEQPMGFWDLDTLKQDAHRLGLRVAHPDVNRSELLCTAEGANTLRLRLTFVKGVDARLGETLLRARESGEFRDLPDLLARSGLSREALEKPGPRRRAGYAARRCRPAAGAVAGGRRLRGRSSAGTVGFGPARGDNASGGFRAEQGRADAG